jgi:hypothetical protein
MLEANCWNFFKPEQPRRFQSAMAGNDPVCFIDQNRSVEAESFGAVPDRANLLWRMLSGVARIRNDGGDREIRDGRSTGGDSRFLCANG